MSSLKDELSFKQITPNLYKIYIRGDKLKIHLYNTKIPFGLENEYDKYRLKIEINEELEEINCLQEIEKILKPIFNVTEEKFKSVIRSSPKYNNLLICSFKHNNPQVDVVFKRKDDYLKSIYDLEKGCLADVVITLDCVWYYPESEIQLGLNLYVTSIGIDN